MSVRDLWLRLRALMRPRRVEEDLHDELHSHVEFEINKLVSGGLPVEQARQRALARFGSVAVAAEECRDARGVRFLTETMADVRSAFRQFRRRPFVTTAMMAVLAIGLGIATTPFILISSFTSTPLAAVDADDRAVRIRGIDLGRGPGHAIGREFEYAEVLEYAARTDVFADVGAWTSTDVVLDLGSGDPPNLQSGAATFVTTSYFRSLGVRPVRGAGLPASFAADAEPQLQAIISDVLWERFYERSDNVIGRTLRVNTTVVTIVGVAPRGFAGARAGGSAIRVWLPVNARPVVQPSAPALRSEAATFGVIARLQPGVSLEQASTVAATIGDRFGTRVSTDVAPLLASNYFPPSGEPSSTGTGPFLSLTMPLLVLLITCTSVSALLAGQALSRRQEIAVRLALGAHRRRIVRQLLTETLLLGLGAGVLALLFLWWLLAGAEAVWFGPGAVLVVDWRAGVFTAALALVASVAFGLSPARHATRATVADVLKEGDSTPGRTRLQSMLVIAQIALTQPALLIMGTLLLELRTELREEAPMTVAADRLVEVGFNTNPRYGSLDDRREEAIARVRARVDALPGVLGAVPAFLGGGGHERLVPHPDDRAEGASGVPEAEVAVQPAPDGYFEVMGLTLAAGRLFSSAEATTATDLAIVNRALARRFWGDAPPMGRRVHIAHNHPPLARTVTVIGVVDHGGQDGEEDGVPELFVAARGETTSHIVVRTEGVADALVPAIRAAALNEAPDVPITTARTRASREAEARRPIMWGVIAAGVSGAVALLLAAIGLYAVVAVSVGQRRREIAVRSALGADGRAITAVFVKRGLGICVVGAVIGLGLSTVAYRVMAEAQMFGESASTPVGGSVIVGGTVFVFAVALIASWIPARRAATIDPWSVLRSE
jgi:putative ABC transport system permease protein